MRHAHDKVLMLAIKAGEILIRSGAEIYRADDAIRRICVACGLTYVETFTTPTGIVLSLGGEITNWGSKPEDSTCDAATSELANEPADSLPSASQDSANQTPSSERRLGTVVKRVAGITTDLEKVSRVSRFVEDFSKGGISVDDGLAQLKAIEVVKPFKMPLRIAAVAVTSLFFTLMNYSDLTGAVCALVIGMISFLLSTGIERLKINRFITIFVSCLVASGLAVLCFNLGLGSSLNAMIIGSLIVFLPGVAITNAARDLLAGDMLSGVARVAEAFLVAFALAGGVGIMLQIAPIAAHPDLTTTYSLPLQCAFSFLGILGLSVMVNIPRRYLLLVPLVGACGWVVYEAIINNAPLLAAGSVKPIACFAGACTVALVAETFTRITREAATVFIIPAIFPFVPGIGMFSTISKVLENNITDALQVGLETAFMAGSIAFALLVVISLSRVARIISAWIQEKRAWGGTD